MFGKGGFLIWLLFVHFKMPERHFLHVPLEQIKEYVDKKHTLLSILSLTTKTIFAKSCVFFKAFDKEKFRIKFSQIDGTNFFFFIRIKHMCTYEQLHQTLQTYIIVPPPARNYKVISPEVLDYVEKKKKKEKETRFFWRELRLLGRKLK